MPVVKCQLRRLLRREPQKIHIFETALPGVAYPVFFVPRSPSFHVPGEPFADAPVKHLPPLTVVGVTPHEVFDAAVDIASDQHRKNGSVTGEVRPCNSICRFGPKVCPMSEIRRARP